MKVMVKILSTLLVEVRRDLSRRHPFAHERVGFFRTGTASTAAGLLLNIRDYRPVDDEDYVYAPDVGASIGSEAMRKAVQSVYRPAGGLLHVHTHGGWGRPGFSHVDLRSARQFVPGFFETTPRMPHGLLVLSNDSAAGLLWLDQTQEPLEISNFISVGATIRQDWVNDDLA